MSAKIVSLEVENVKRVQAVELSPDANGLTVIGGRNGQGKTSVLDAIMWALGGDRFKPTKPVRAGAEKLVIKVEMNNGVTVERKGVAGALKVTSATGKGGQALLNEFVNGFALNLPKFMSATGTEKANMLLDAYPEKGAEIQRMNEGIKRLYNERLALGQIADRKRKYADELPFDPEAPDQPLTGTEMSTKLRDAMAINAKNEALRQNTDKALRDLESERKTLERRHARVKDLEKQLAEARSEAEIQVVAVQAAEANLAQAKLKTKLLRDLDTSTIEREMEEIDALNAKVRANESKRLAEAEADDLREQYNDMSHQIDKLRSDRLALLQEMDLPLEGLLIDEDGEIIYQDAKWDCMSGAEQLKVATAICAAMKPDCGFVLLDKLEAMDVETLAEFSEWLKDRKLQAIGTRVGTGDENSIIIEDGVSVPAEYKF